MSNYDARLPATTRLTGAPGPLLAAFLTLVLVAACTDGSDLPGDQANDRLAITNTPFLLELRVTEVDTTVPIDPDSGSGKVGADSSTEKVMPVRLRLVAAIDPPVVDGQVVQATSISLDGGDKAMVSYNMAGAPRLGAIDFLTKLTERRPTLTSSVTFNDSDVNAVTTDGTYVYAAVATDTGGFPFPAVLERIRLENDRFVLRDADRIALTSFAATSTARTSDEIYATSGDGGSVFAFTKSDLDPLGEFPLHDARWVAWDKDNQRVAVVQGTPGQISVFEEGEFPGGSMRLLNSYSFPGADVPESKSTVDVAGGKAFVAAGPQGVQVVCLDDGQIVGSVPVPDAESLGLDPADVVTNAVAVDKDLMFISNGGAGIFIAQGSEEFKDTDCSTPQQISLIGRLRFDDFQSVNHVEFENDHLIIAAGLSGVKVVRVSID